jgi:hypothetical protein
MSSFMVDNIGYNISEFLYSLRLIYVSLIGKDLSATSLTVEAIPFNYKHTMLSSWVPATDFENTIPVGRKVNKATFYFLQYNDTAMNLVPLRRISWTSGTIGNFLNMLAKKCYLHHSDVETTGTSYFGLEYIRISVNRGSWENNTTKAKRTSRRLEVEDDRFVGEMLCVLGMISCVMRNIAGTTSTWISMTWT